MILASGSKVRRAMLENAGVAVEAQPARVDEAAIKEAMRAENAPARDIADTLAEMKALRVSTRFGGELVLGADQVLVCGDVLYDKPTSIEEARAHLAALRSKTHQLISAAVIVQDGQPIWRHIGVAKLTMRPFSDAFLDSYLDRFGEEALTSVGAYHLEGLGAQLFSRVEGDYFTILGLPLLEVLGFLRARGELIE
ncbi:Maf family protein [Rhodobacteraceae bacterium NNCM2]|nr:Maf family protein [Coraliihabitans acroporae]